MIVDVHGHLQAPNTLYAFAQGLLNTRGMEGRPAVGISDEALEASAKGNLEIMDSVGTDVRFTSPRPYLMHSERPTKIIEWWIQALNDTILRQHKAHPRRLQAVCALPQISGESPKNCIEELERVAAAGAIGITLNPDPGEGDNQTPTLGDEWWYPLYEAMQRLDMPALIHSSSCRYHQRESYIEHMITEESIAVANLCRSTVFQDFPNLKIIISHGGGSVPFQIGRWRSMRMRPGRSEGESFDEALRRLYFDTCLYTQNSLELLCKEIPIDRLLFGTEKPGVGSQTDPSTGEVFDDIKPKLQRISFLTDEDRTAIFEGNARRVFTRWHAS